MTKQSHRRSRAKSENIDIAQQMPNKRGNIISRAILWLRQSLDPIRGLDCATGDMEQIIGTPAQKTINDAIETAFRVTGCLSRFRSRRFRLRTADAQRTQWIEIKEPDAASAAYGRFGVLQKHRALLTARTESGLLPQSASVSAELDAFTLDLFNVADKLAANIQLLPYLESFGAAEDQPVVQRLLVMRFIRVCYEFRPKIRTALEQFVRQQPTPCLADVARHTLRQVIRGHRNYVLRHAVVDSIPLRTLLQIRLQVAYHDLLHAIVEWQKQGLSVRSLPDHEFNIFGVALCPPERSEIGDDHWPAAQELMANERDGDVYRGAPLFDVRHFDL